MAERRVPWPPYEPGWEDAGDVRRQTAAFLDFYRAKAIEKVASLTPEQQATSVVPSGWTPLEMLNHLAHMEQRWFVWGFLGESVTEPLGDEVDGRWVLAEGRGLDDVVAMMRRTGERTTHVLAACGLDEPARLGGKFTDEHASVPDLAWVCEHVTHEYARHLGHLDVAVELLSGATGE